jgi:hypothetical protein
LALSGGLINPASSIAPGLAAGSLQPTSVVKTTIKVKVKAEICDITRGNAFRKLRVNVSVFINRMINLKYFIQISDRARKLLNRDEL